MQAKTALFGLYGGAVAIIAVGALLLVGGLLGKVNVAVMGGHLPLAVFGAVSIFLGVRYVRSVRVLAREVRENPCAFSWRNFLPRRSE